MSKHSPGLRDSAVRKEIMQSAFAMLRNDDKSPSRMIQDALKNKNLEKAKELLDRYDKRESSAQAKKSRHSDGKRKSRSRSASLSELLFTSPSSSRNKSREKQKRRRSSSSSSSRSQGKKDEKRRKRSSSASTSRSRSKSVDSRKRRSRSRTRDVPATQSIKTIPVTGNAELDMYLGGRQLLRKSLPGSIVSPPRSRGDRSVSPDRRRSRSVSRDSRNRRNPRSLSRASHEHKGPDSVSQDSHTRRNQRSISRDLHEHQGPNSVSRVSCDRRDSLDASDYQDPNSVSRVSYDLRLLLRESRKHIDPNSVSWVSRDRRGSMDASEYRDPISVSQDFSEHQYRRSDSWDRRNPRPALLDDRDPQLFSRTRDAISPGRVHSRNGRSRSRSRGSSPDRRRRHDGSRGSDPYDKRMGGPDLDKGDYSMTEGGWKMADARDLLSDTRRNFKRAKMVIDGDAGEKYKPVRYPLKFGDGWDREIVANKVVKVGGSRVEQKNERSSDFDSSNNDKAVTIERANLSKGQRRLLEDGFRRTGIGLSSNKSSKTSASEPLVHSGPKMDDPSLVRKTISSKEFDTLERERKQQELEQKQKGDEKKEKSDKKKKKKGEKKGVKDNPGFKKTKRRKDSSAADEAMSNDQQNEDEKRKSGLVSGSVGVLKAGLASGLLNLEDIEKEIERRVQERLKLEEAKLMEAKLKEEKAGKEKSPKQRDDKKGKKEDSPNKDKGTKDDDSSTDNPKLIRETQHRWTEDCLGNPYFAIRGIKQREGYTKDKYGKQYFVGHKANAHKYRKPSSSTDDPILIRETKQGLSGDCFGNPYWAVRGTKKPEGYATDRNGKTYFVGHYANALKRPKSRSGSRDKSDGKPSKSQSSPRLSRERNSSRRKSRSRSRSRERRFSKYSSRSSRERQRSRSKERGQRRRFSPGPARDKSSPESKTKSRWDDDDKSGSPSGRKPPASRWSEDEGKEKEKGGLVDKGEVEEGKDEGGEESLTELEKFLTQLKNTKKSQWIAEGKVKEK